MVDELDSREIRREEVIRAQIVEVGRRLYLRSYVASNDGNISVRLGNNHLITTPKGISKGFIKDPLGSLINPLQNTNPL